MRATIELHTPPTVSAASHLLRAVLEQHGPLTQRGRRALQRGVHLRRVRAAQAAALALQPPARAHGQLLSCRHTPNPAAFKTKHTGVAKVRALLRHQ